MRKDPFGPTWVIISPERGLRASDFGSAEHGTDRCPLCPGHEGELGTEIRTLRPTLSRPADWRVRVVRPLTEFSETRAFEPSGSSLFTHAPSSGYLELVVEHPDHRMVLSKMPREHLVELLKVYRDRLEHLATRPGIRHVQITRNVGRAAGALYEHPHAQVLALPVANRWLTEERHAAGEHAAEAGSCLFCDVIAAEFGRKERVISYNSSFVALAPYASKTPFETWILPRQHDSAFSGLASNALPQLADLLQSVLRAMNSALDYPPYNMLVHTLPHSGDESYHWQIKILPRLTTQAGFDWGSGFYVNPTPPEDAVRFLREALALQEVGQGVGV